MVVTLWEGGKAVILVFLPTGLSNCSFTKLLMLFKPKTIIGEHKVVLLYYILKNWYQDVH